MKLAELFVELTSNSADFNARMESTKNILESVGKSMEKVSRKAKAMLLVGSAALTGILKLTSDYQETLGKFKVVFGEEGKAARKFGEDLAKSLGRGEAQTLNFLATLQATFTSFSLTSKEARLLSQQVTQLAFDMAAFNNSTDDEALRRLNSALVGNIESLRSWGTIITQQRLNQKLLELGFKKVTQGASETEKVMARLALIMEINSFALGAAERESGSLANRLKKLRAEFGTLAITIGTIFVPAAEKTLTFLTSLVKPLREWVSANQKTTVSLIKLTAAVLALVAVGPALLTFLTTLLAHPLLAVVAAAVAAAAALAIFADRVGDLRDPIVLFNDEIEKAIGNFDKLTDAQKRNTEVQIQEAISDLIKQMQELEKKSDQLRRKMSGKDNTILGANPFGEGGNVGAIERFLKRVMGTTEDQFDKIAAKIQMATDKVKVLREQLELLRGTKPATKAAPVFGPTPEEIADAKKLLAELQLQILEDFEERRQRARKLAREQTDIFKRGIADRVEQGKAIMVIEKSLKQQLDKINEDESNKLKRLTDQRIREAKRVAAEKKRVAAQETADRKQAAQQLHDLDVELLQRLGQNMLADLLILDKWKKEQLELAKGDKNREQKILDIAKLRREAILKGDEEKDSDSFFTTGLAQFADQLQGAIFNADKDKIQKDQLKEAKKANMILAKIEKQDRGLVVI